MSRAPVLHLYPDSESDPLADLVDRFSKRLLAKLRLAQANGRSGWDRDDWEKECQQGLLKHIAKGDPRDVAAYCAFMDHHGWITVPAAPQVTAHAQASGMREVLAELVACNDAFWRGNSDQAGAYYSMIKGKDKLWERARAVLAAQPLAVPSGPSTEGK